MLGATAGVVWLVLPVLTSDAAGPVALGGAGRAASTPTDPAAREPEDRAADFAPALPAAVLGVTTALAGYGYVRRVRRSRTRTTPGGGALAVPVPAEAPPPADPVARPAPAARAPLAGYARRAQELLPAALADAEAELSAVADTLTAVRAGLPSGAGTEPEAYDPLDALRHVVRVCLPLGPGRTGALSAAALLAARAAVSDAEGFLAAHRDAVGRAARTQLAEARRLLASSVPTELVSADLLAHRARALAEQDVLRTAL